MVGAVGAVGAAGTAGTAGAAGAVLGPLTEGDPRRIGPHSAVGRLGVGALGPLYGGYSDDGRAVAIRALRPELLADEAVRARLAADVAAARTVSVPSAAPVLDADLDGETPWLASAFVAGVPLAKAVADHGPLPEPALLSLAAGLAEALAALNAAGVMHGDLRPGTVLLTPEGPRIVDYALVRAFDGVADAGLADLGVPGFLAPEQALGRTVTPAADMFALGSTLFFAATGRPPFGEGTREELKKRVAKSSPVLGKLPAALPELVRGCLQKDANGRAQPQQVVEYVQRRTPVPFGGGWLPPAVAADVRAAAEAGLGRAGDPDPDASATIVVGPMVSHESPQPAPGGQPPGFGAGPQQTTEVAALYRQPGATTVSGMPGARPAPSRRNLLLALTGGAVAVAGGTAVAVGFSGSSGTTTAADAQPSGAVGAVPTGAGPSTSAPAPGSGRGSSGAPDTAGQLPLPQTGPLAPPIGAAGTLEGPDAKSFWSLTAGGVSSLAAGDHVLVVADESGVSGYDFGSNLKWGPVRASGVRGSGNGVVESGLVYLIVAPDQGVAGGGAGAGSDLLALDVQTGEQKWRSAAPQGGWSDLRVGGASSGIVFVAGTAGAVPVLWAVDAFTGRSLWQKSGVDFATVAVPPSGMQILTAGSGDPTTAGAVAGLDIRTGEQVWSRPLRTAVDYGHVSLNKIAYVGDHYVLLLSDQAQPDTLSGGTANGGEATWNSALPVPPEDAGSISFVTGLPESDAVVVLSHHGLYAADARTGMVRWQTQGADLFATASDDGAPQCADGNVYVHDQQGTWWAVDFATGRTRWKYAVRGYDRNTEPVWIAVPGGVVVAAGGAVALVAAGG